MAEDLRPRLEGRRLVGVPTPINGSAASRLFRHVGEVPRQRSIIVYRNGDVTEKLEFTTSEINDQEVYAYIPGGSDFRQSDDTWLNEALEAQGYTFEPVD